MVLQPTHELGPQVRHDQRSRYAVAGDVVERYRVPLARDAEKVVVVAADLGELPVVDGDLEVLLHLGGHLRQVRGLHLPGDREVLLDDAVGLGELALLLVEPLVRDLQVVVRRGPERALSLELLLEALVPPEEARELLRGEGAHARRVPLREHFVELRARLDARGGGLGVSHVAKARGGGLEVCARHQ